MLKALAVRTTPISPSQWEVGISPCPHLVQQENRFVNRTFRLVISSLSKFLSDRSGISAVEFALILPVMLVLYVGMAEFARAFDNWRKLEAASRTISDMTSQGDSQTPMRSSTMNDILASATLVMRPFDGSTAKIRVSAMGVDLVRFSLTKPKVCSSVSSSNIVARTVGVAADLTIPPGFQMQGTRYILVELTSAYTPMLGSALVGLIGGGSGSFNLSATIPWPTRTDNEIVLPGGVAC